MYKIIFIECWKIVGLLEWSALYHLRILFVGVEIFRY